MNTLAVFFIIALGAVLSMSQTLVYWWMTPPGKIFLFAHNYLEDYYYYLHIMKQGMDGAWFATSHLTPDIFPGQFVAVFFLFLGHLSKIFNISLPVMYALSRASGALTLFYLVYLFIKRIYQTKEKRILALIVVIFGTFWWPVVHGEPQVPWLVKIWTELDPLFRGSYIPHHLWSKIFFLLSLLMLTSNKRMTPTRIVLLILTVSAMGFASPVIMIVFVPLVSIWLIVELTVKKPGAASVLSIITAILIAVYHRHIQYSVFPWTGSYIVWENSIRYPITFISFLESLGPAFVFFLFGIPRLIRTSPLTRLLAVWAGVGFLLLFAVGRFVPLANSRYLSGYYFIPIGIGAIGGIWEINRLINKIVPRIADWFMFVVFTLLFIYFAVGLWTTWQLHLSYIRQNSANLQVYLPGEILNSFRYLDQHSQPGEVVLARYMLSTMIPAFTSNRVVAGHALMSVDNEARHQEIEKFYGYELSAAEARTWLGSYRVRFIIEDQATSQTDQYYQLLGARTVYMAGKVKLYKI